MAELSWQQVLGWNSDQLDDLRFAGYSYFREGHYAKSILFFKTLNIIDPKNAYDVQTLRGLHLMTNEGHEALLYLNKALALDPSHEPTLLNKAKALLMIGQKQEALDLINILKKSKNALIADDATALFMAYVG